MLKDFYDKYKRKTQWTSITSIMFGQSKSDGQHGMVYVILELNIKKGYKKRPSTIESFIY